MKLIESKVELLEQGPDLDGVYKQIELAGRTCYKSEDKITDSSSVDFVKRMAQSGHTAMLEHGTVYLMKSINVWPQISFNRYYRNPYSKAITKDGVIYVTTNLRVLQENNWLDDLQFLCEPTEYHERRISLKFTTSIGITRELVRHRVFSFANESTRYCNYTKNKFNNELTFIKPSWFDDEQHKGDKYKMMLVTTALMQAEKYYMDLISGKTIITQQQLNEPEVISSVEMTPMTPQQAREFLPLCTKSDIVMTGFVSDWKHFFDLRLLGTTGKPHPDMLLLAEKARKVLEEHDLWRLIYKPN